MREVLFLRTANACPSQMAEGIARQLLSPELPGLSAGTRPTDVDSRAVRVMSELGLDISTQRSKSIEEIPRGAAGRVVTLCGDATEHSVLGGSGFYDLPGLEDVERFEVETPFGPPSSPLLAGRLHGRRVVFVARHGEGHRLLPSEVNARANILTPPATIQSAARLRFHGVLGRRLLAEDLRETGVAG